MVPIEGNNHIAYDGHIQVGSILKRTLKQTTRIIILVISSWTILEMRKMNLDMSETIKHTKILGNKSNYARF